MIFRYVEEKFQQAIDALIGASSLADRLETAATYLSRLGDEDFQNHAALGDEFFSLKNELTQISSVGGAGSIRATIQQMSSAELEERARQIHSLYRHLMEAKAVTAGLAV